MQDLMPLMIKPLRINGDKMLDHQQLHLLLSLLETKEFQIAIMRTMMLLLLPSRNNTMMLKCTDKTKLMPKKMLINGEKDSLQVQDQLSTL
jgi:hypothetical protein